MIVLRLYHCKVSGLLSRILVMKWNSFYDTNTPLWCCASTSEIVTSDLNDRWGFVYKVSSCCQGFLPPDNWSRMLLAGGECIEWEPTSIITIESNCIHTIHILKVVETLVES